ncbi:hypothetical protein [Phaeocystidibacter marisrubri]|uniref:Uncharacterized protein n=1 Tax=Phaeocystidibacter marisrubri TaxID=1577780 RepID=A0A6L3ZCM3_9FLAO|nr:hypothetical protein [Phaeocystidibacter marisrubri]KAB2815191.1 hypothetical protein F8C82_13930 [Phaeocystidibacter marisrubri]
MSRILSLLVLVFGLTSCYTVNNTVTSSWRALPETTSNDTSYQLISPSWNGVNIVSTPIFSMAMSACESTTRYEAYCLTVTNRTEEDQMLAPHFFAITHSDELPVLWSEHSLAWDNNDVWELDQARSRASNWNVSMMTLTISSIFIVLGSLGPPQALTTGRFGVYDPNVEYYSDLVGLRVLTPGETATFNLYFDDKAYESYRKIWFSTDGGFQHSPYTFTFERITGVRM